MAILPKRRLRPRRPAKAHLLGALRAWAAVDHQGAQRAPHEGGACAGLLFLRGSGQGLEGVRAQHPPRSHPPGPRPPRPESELRITPGPGEAG